jgi:hypothetical protein
MSSWSVTSGASDNCPVLIPRGGQATFESGTFPYGEYFTQPQIAGWNPQISGWKGTLLALKLDSRLPAASYY